MKVREIFNKFFGQITNTKTLIVIFIIGVSLIMFPAGNKEDISVKKSDEGTYKAEIEHQLSEIIGKIKGAGKVSVMVTFSDNGNTYYATDEKTDSESDSKSFETTHVFSDAGNKKEALIVRKTQPQIAGVLICASGAGNIEIRKNIISAVSALTGVKSHRIEVLERG